LYQRLADEDAALHTAGQRAHVGVCLRGEVQVVQDLVDPRAALAQAEVAGLHLERFADAEKRVKHQFLGHYTQIAARFAVVGNDVVPEYFRRAAIGADQSREDRNERGLARSVGAQQPEELPFLDLEVHAVQGPHAAEAARDIGHVDGNHQGAGIKDQESEDGERQQAVTRGPHRDLTGEEVQDAVHVRQRMDARRDRREFQAGAFGGRAPLQRQHHRERGRVGLFQTGQVDNSATWQRQCARRLEHGGRVRERQRAHVRPALACRDKGTHRFVACAFDHDLAEAPLFLAVSVLMSPSTPPFLTCSLNSSR
jgi:hypothetical protein